MFTWDFWKDTLERSICTFAEAMLGYLTVNTIADVDWKNALSVSAVAFLVTIFKCIVFRATADIKARQNDRI